MVTTEAPTLPAWLLEQIAEDEAEARAIQARVAADPGSYVVLGLAHPELAAGDCPSDLGEYDPARALRQCEAYRRIMAQVGEAERDTYESGEAISILGSVALDSVKHLAAIYADRPGYQEAWRP